MVKSLNVVASYWLSGFEFPEAAAVAASFVDSAAVRTLFFKQMGF